MSSKFLDSMLTKYQAEGGPGSVVNYSSQHARMYPYVSMGAHQSAGAFGGAGGIVGGYSNALAGVGVGSDTDKQCRFTGAAAAASMAGMAEAMVNYSLGAAAHQNGAAVSASMAQAAAAGFYQAAGGGGGPGGVGGVGSVGGVGGGGVGGVGGNPNDPMSACSHGASAAAAAAAAGLGLGGVQSGVSGPDIPRYPWMSITGTQRIPFTSLVYSLLVIGLFWFFLPIDGELG